jgi:hypothetical protein
MTDCLTLSQFHQTFLTNPSKVRIYTNAKFLLSSPNSVNQLALRVKPSNHGRSHISSVPPTPHNKLSHENV